MSHEGIRFLSKEEQERVEREEHRAGKLSKAALTPAKVRVLKTEGTGVEIDLDVCRYYDLLYAMRSAAFWMSATGLFATGRNTALRLARTAWSVPVVLDNAARALGY